MERTVFLPLTRKQKQKNKERGQELTNYPWIIFNCSFATIGIKVAERGMRKTKKGNRKPICIQMDTSHARVRIGADWSLILRCI